MSCARWPMSAAPRARSPCPASMAGWSTKFPSACVSRPAGSLSVPGVYGGLIDKFPFGMAMQKGLTIRTGQTHVNRWTDDLLRRIEDGQIDPSFVITHRVRLEDGPDMYRTFRDKQDGCIKVVMSPQAS